jgi:hypothetical protein
VAAVPGIGPGGPAGSAGVSGAAGSSGAASANRAPSAGGSARDGQTRPLGSKAADDLLRKIDEMGI